MRRFIFAVVLLLGVSFVLTRFAEFGEIAATLQRGDWRWLALAALVQFTWLLNLGVSYRAVYRALGMEEDLLDLTLLAVAANFVNVVAPTGGMGGIALFVTDARRKGHSGARATLAGVLFVLYEYLSFICVLALGLIVLVRRHNLSYAELTASAILVAVALALSGLLALGLHSAEVLERVLVWAVRLVNRVVRPISHRISGGDYLSPDTASHFATEAAEALARIRHRPKHLAMPAALALNSKALLITVLFLTFLAFKQPFSVGTLIAGFSLGYLFFIVSPTPSGIGVVEGAMTIGLNTLRVPIGAATVITLAYRTFTFWLPLLLGSGALRLISRRIPEKT